MSTDVSASTVTSSGTVYGGRTRVRGLVWVNAATAGSINLRSGGASGTILLTVATPGNSGWMDLDVPANGILFDVDVYATLSNITSLTVLYG